jgi:tRNA(fMet)-specific endonuclease VapC
MRSMPKCERHWSEAGTLIGANDLLIATRTLSLGLALVTDNAGKFSRVPGLGVENWLAP